jgi:hypothetical protein
MYNRLLKLIEAENDKWKKASKEPGDRVPAEQIRGNRVAPGMMGGMRGEKAVQHFQNQIKATGPLTS